MFACNADALPYLSTCTEWSITRSTGIAGLILLGSPPISFIAERRDARSTTTGTPVKSCNTTREGLNGTSASGSAPLPHFANSFTCSSLITYASY